MSNRDEILDSHPSERVKMPPELAAFDRWDADPNDLAKWEPAMAALAPAAGADNSNATVNLYASKSKLVFQVQLGPPPSPPTPNFQPLRLILGEQRCGGAFCPGHRSLQ